MSHSGFLNKRFVTQVHSYLGTVPRDPNKPLIYRISMEELAGGKTSHLKEYFHSSTHGAQKGLRSSASIAVLFPTAIQGLPCTHPQARSFIQELAKEYPGFAFFCNLEGKGLWNIVLCLLGNITCVDIDHREVSITLRRSEFFDLTQELIWDGITHARLHGCSEAEIEVLASELHQYFKDWSRNCQFD